MVRKAGQVTREPGFWESLGDNSYTRGWSGLVANVLRPADRMMASDAELKTALARSFSGGRNGAVVDQMAMLDSLDPTGGLKGRYVDKGAAAVEQMKVMAASEGLNISDREALELVVRDSLLKGVKRDALMGAMDKYGPSLPVTDAAQWAHGVLGNAAAAYGLPLAGAGMATWGIHDVLMAQQQAEKESQLPLS